MSRAAKVTVVLPVHNGRAWIEAEVARIAEALAEFVREPVEILVVDDGSRDGTAEVLEALAAARPGIRLARHSRRLGLEAAGQTGLERATGDLVFIQEGTGPIRIEDLRRLYQMSDDPTLVAARAQTGSMGSRRPLIRRLRAWGVRTHHSFRDCGQHPEPIAEPVAGVQMVRRPHLRHLSSNHTAAARLWAERVTIPAPISVG